MRHSRNQKHGQSRQLQGFHTDLFFWGLTWRKAQLSSLTQPALPTFPPGAWHFQRPFQPPRCLLLLTSAKNQEVLPVSLVDYPGDRPKVRSLVAASITATPGAGWEDREGVLGAWEGSSGQGRAGREKRQCAAGVGWGVERVAHHGVPLRDCATGLLLSRQKFPVQHTRSRLGGGQFWWNLDFSFLGPFGLGRDWRAKKWATLPGLT